MKGSSLTYAQSAARLADDKLGQDIVVLDVRKQTSVTDYFLFVTGTTHVHIRALEDAIREGLKEEGATLQRTDGQRGQLWRALDYGSVIVHLMDAKTREFYSIERLWDQSKQVEWAVPKPKKAKPAAKKKTSTKKKK